MGILVPENFPMETLVNDAERLVVSTLVDRLTDGWYVIPDVGILRDRDRQTDIVVAHERDGVCGRTLENTQSVERLVQRVAPDLALTPGLLLGLTRGVSCRNTR
jgi:hypothetical protein